MSRAADKDERGTGARLAVGTTLGLLVVTMDIVHMSKGPCHSLTPAVLSRPLPRTGARVRSPC